MGIDPWQVLKIMNCMSHPLCTIPAEEGEDQDPVILPGRDPDGVMSTD